MGELVQFKESLIEYMRNKNEDCTQTFDTQFIDMLYSTVPKSSIVFAHRSNIDEIEKFKSIAHELYDKYIKINAEFEVNISYSLRLEYVKLNKNEWEMEPMELMQVFEKVMMESIAFMRQSFDRYQQHIAMRSVP